MLIRPHPGRILRNRVLPNLNMSPDMFADFIDFDREYVEQFVGLNVPVTEELAEAMAARNCGDRKLWLKLQAAFDTQTAPA